MKQMIASLAVVGICTIMTAGCVSNSVSTTSSSMFSEPNARNSQPPVTAGNSESMLEQAIQEQWFKTVGVKPGTKKAEILLKWRQEIRNDPELKAALVKSLPSLQTPAGVFVMEDGMARITPAQRAEFWSLYARVAASHLPKDCYGERNPVTISSRLMTFGNFTDDDAEEYLRLFSALLRAHVRHDPEHVPTVAAHQAATLALGKILEANIKDKSDADRAARVVLNPATAPIEDTCWFRKASILGINQLPPADKEAILSNAAHQSANAAARLLAAPAAPGSAPKAAQPAVERL